MSATKSAPTASASRDAEAPWPYRFEVLALDDLYVDRYQRPLKERWLKARESKFNPALLGTITVSQRTRRGKHYSIIDGQQRSELCRRVGLTHVPCLVFYDVPIEYEASVFSSMQRERTAISPFERFTSDLVAGNEQAKAIQKMTESEGFTLSATQEDAGHIKAVRAIEMIYEDNPAHLRRVLVLIRDTWKELPYARNERMIKGVWYFVREVEDLDEQRFVERLSAVSPSTLATRAQQLRDGSGLSNAGLPKFLREAIENEYRSRRKPRG